MRTAVSRTGGDHGLAGRPRDQGGHAGGHLLLLGRPGVGRQPWPSNCWVCPQVKNYYCGWQEWSADEQAPAQVEAEPGRRNDELAEPTWPKTVTLALGTGSRGQRCAQVQPGRSASSASRQRQTADRPAPDLTLRSGASKTAAPSRSWASASRRRLDDLPEPAGTTIASGTAGRRTGPRRPDLPRSAAVGCTWPCGRCARPSRS